MCTDRSYRSGCFSDVGSAGQGFDGYGHRTEMRICIEWDLLSRYCRFFCFCRYSIPSSFLFRWMQGLERIRHFHAEAYGADAVGRLLWGYRLCWLAHCRCCVGLPSLHGVCSSVRSGGAVTRRHRSANALSRFSFSCKNENFVRRNRPLRFFIFAPKIFTLWQKNF